MNKEYIINKVRPHLNNRSMLAEDDFNKLFSRLTRSEQYEIINLLIEEDIEIDYENAGDKKSNATINPAAVPSNVYSIDKLTNEQLCVIFKRGNRSALDALISKNSRLVWSRVIKYSRKYRHKLDDEDLSQYGTIGLIKAAEKFEVEKEAKFTTYAIWWIDQAILRAIADHGFTIRIPVHYFEQVNSIMRILSQNPGCTKPQICELAQQRGVSRDKLEDILMIIENIMSPASLNACVGDDQESELGDFKVDDISLSVEEQVEYSVLRETIELALNTLTPKEKDIIEQRFGLNDGIERTLEHIGSKYNITRERIRQIEAKSLEKLNHPSITKKLKDFL